MTAIYLPGQMDFDRKLLSSEKPRDVQFRLIEQPLKPTKPQLPCDLGLFSDDSLQTDLIEMLMNPHE